MATEDVLSEGELDALMDTFASDDAPDGGAASERSCQPFDFSRREQTLLAQMPVLKKLNEKQSLALVESIQESYGISAQVEADETRLLKLDQAIGAIPEPSGINLITTAPLNGVSFVVLPGDLLSFFVDKYFGGAQAGAPASNARTTLTPTETRINEVLTEKFLSTLVDAWQEKIKLIPELKSFEFSPAFLQASSPDELALLFSFVITVGDWKSSIDWIVPYAALEPMRSKFGSPASSTKSKAKNADWEKHFRRELQSVDLEVTGSFASGRANISDVLNLKPGSIVPLKMPTDVTVCIENQMFSYGEHGVLNGNKSIKIKEIIRREIDNA
jgi:flagellar motor switch protein FliM